MPERFSVPVVVEVPLAKNGPCVMEIATPRDGMVAMNRLGLGGFRMESPEWQSTIHILGRATLAPTPENLEEAREALQRFARQCAH